ncbi:RNase A-like domain-containing protein [Pilimelia columellifera]|uniref:Bacterial CdiA-CT RNAse A domain-containing protein n=1 Tax=Pilimelia columellifera subsp. columellifera TaxID=706583 RepID=A0ABP6ACT7_9ACTN
MNARSWFVGVLTAVVLAPLAPVVAHAAPKADGGSPTLAQQALASLREQEQQRPRWQGRANGDNTPQAVARRTVMNIAETTEDPEIREAAEAALAGGHPAIMEFISSGHAAAEKAAKARKSKADHDNIAAIGKLGVGGPWFNAEVERVLKGTPEDRVAFLSYGSKLAAAVDERERGWSAARAAQLRSRVQALTTAGGVNVAKAANNALAKGDAAILEFFTSDAYIKAAKADTDAYEAKLKADEAALAATQELIELARRAGEAAEARTQIIKANGEAVLQLQTAANAMNLAADHARQGERVITGPSTVAQKSQELGKLKPLIANQVDAAHSAAVLAESAARTAGTHADRLVKIDMPYGAQWRNLAESMSQAAAAASGATQTAAHTIDATIAANKATGHADQAEAHKAKAEKFLLQAQKHAKAAEALARAAKIEADAAENAADRAHDARLLAEKAEAEAEAAADRAHQKRLLAEQERDNAARWRGVAESERAKAAGAYQTAQRNATIASGARAEAVRLAGDATRARERAEGVEERASEVRDRAEEHEAASARARDNAVRAERAKRAADARKAAIEAAARQAETQADRDEALALLPQANQAAGDATAAASGARGAANTATGAAAGARAAATEAQRAAGRAWHAAGQAQAAAGRADAAASAAEREAQVAHAAALRADAAAATATHQEIEARDRAANAQRLAEQARNEAIQALWAAQRVRAEADAAARESVSASEQAENAVRSAGAARQAASALAQPASTAIVLAAPFLGEDLAADFATQVAKLALSIGAEQATQAENRANEANAAAARASQAAEEAADLVRPAFQAAADAAKSAAVAAKEAARARKAAARAAKEGALAREAAARAHQHDQRAQQEASAARAAANQAASDAAIAGQAASAAQGYADRANAAANRAELDAAAAQKAATAAEKEAKRAQDSAARTQKSVDAVVKYAEKAQANADEAEKAAERAEDAEREAAAKNIDAPPVQLSAAEEAELRDVLGEEAYQAYLAARNLSLNGIKQYFEDNWKTILAGIVGWDDIKDCFVKGDFVACLWTVASILPIGKGLKLLKTLGELIPGLIKHYDKIKDAKKALDDVVDRFRGVKGCKKKPRALVAAARSDDPADICGIPGGGLNAHEGVGGGHVLAKHSGKSDDWLRDRLAKEKKKPMVSTFTDQASAEKAITLALQQQRKKLAAFLNKPAQQTTRITATGISGYGRVLERGASQTRPGSTVIVEIARDPNFPGSYRINTAYLS